VLLTNLHNRTQPLIRYELTDHFIRRPADGDPYLHATVEGRADEAFRYGTVTVDALMIRTAMVKAPQVAEYQVRQTGNGIDVAVIAGGALDREALAPGGSEGCPRTRSVRQGTCAGQPAAVSSGDVSRNDNDVPAPAGGWLDGDQQRAWLAYIRVQLRLAYEMNRQLLADSGMSLPDYDVLTALSVAEGGRMQITVLAAQIGWERSRVSHHVRRMSARGLVTCDLSATDRRVTEVTLTAHGRQAQEEAARGHVDLVRRLFFEGLPADLVAPLSEALESVYANIIKQGSLPPPIDWHPAEKLRDTSR
jgi:DNA-binding MarR family transcriptional regulator